MFSPKTAFIFISLIFLTLLGCQPSSVASNSRIPGIYHIRIELGNSMAGREDEIYIDFDSTKTVQSMNYFKYDESDSIVFNKSFKLDNKIMDSLFLYSVQAVRNENLFSYDKYAPADGHNVTVEIISNERMIRCTYSNIMVASLASPQLGKLARIINANAENNILIK